MSFQIGDIIGAYKIVGVVGSGGMGHVFQVEHTITRRLEAMKVLLRGQGNEVELSRRFLREVQVQASLNHPNIASVYNAFSVGDELVMVMELVDGESLERLLARGRIPWPAAIGYACQALAALAYAHAHGVTHRDIKPANIMITGAGAVKLMDFGLAKAPSDHVRLTRSGAVLGSVHYMPPEQVKGTTKLDARSDIYSLGVVLYEMLTGSTPFNGDGAFAIMCGHVGEDPTPPIERNPDLPPALNDAILIALAKKSEERFASAEAFRQALERVHVDAVDPVRGSRPFLRQNGGPLGWSLSRRERP
ncbi:MAG: serine/threonine protein kinase [Acidobacteria bacterium]|nr:serine/threonine protein kinase [Acidobacteriota bacterium]